MTDPPVIGDVALAVARRFRAPLVVVSQDVFPEIAVELGGSRTRVVVALLRVLVAPLPAPRRPVVAIGETMRARLVEKGARADRVARDPELGRHERAHAGRRATTRGRARHGLDGRVRRHALGQRRARAGPRHAHPRRDVCCASSSDLAVVIVGGGARHARARRARRALDARQACASSPYQPRDVLSQSLSSGRRPRRRAGARARGLRRAEPAVRRPRRGRPVIVAADAESETRADRRGRGLRRRRAAGPARSARGRDPARPRRRARPRRDGQTRPGLRHARGRPAHRRGSLPHTAGGIAMRESRLVTPLFLAAVFCSTFEKVHWNVAGTVYLADVTTLLFLAVWALDRAGHHGRRVPRTAGVLLLFLVGFLLVYLIGFFNLDTQQAAAQFGKGVVKWLIHFVFLIVAVIYLAGRSRRVLLAHARVVLRGDHVQRGVRDPAARRRAGRPQPRLVLHQAADARREPDQRLRRGRGDRTSTGRTRSPATRTTSGSCCSCRCSCCRRSTCGSSGGIGCGCRSRF